MTCICGHPRSAHEGERCLALMAEVKPTMEPVDCPCRGFVDADKQGRLEL